MTDRRFLKYAENLTFSECRKFGAVGDDFRVMLNQRDDDALNPGDDGFDPDEDRYSLFLREDHAAWGVRDGVLRG